MIIGGGVAGTSIAYHLAQLGWNDVVLVDRRELTSGSTFHSAGLVGQLRSSLSLTKMMMYSVELYRKLGGGEFDPGWTECGGIRLACTPERWEETRRQAGWAKTFGLPLELISPEEARERFPLMVTDGVIGASWLPTDGYLDPSQLTYALADGARRGGCEISTHTRVTGIDVERGAVTGVQTDRGDDRVRGRRQRGRHVRGRDRPARGCARADRADGARVPRHAAVPRALRRAPSPTMRDPDHLIYFREEGGGLVMGGYERESAPWALSDGGRGLDAIPSDFNGRLLEEDWDRLEEIVAIARMRVPVMDNVGITRLINGPEAFTPDGEFCLGETEVRGLFVAAGFCAHGLAGRRRHRQGDGRVDRRRRARSSTCGRWTSGASAPTTARRPTRSSACARSTRPTTTSSTPTTSGRRGVRCASRRLTTGTASTAPRSARSPAGSA